MTVEPMSGPETPRSQIPGFATAFDMVIERGLPIEVGELGIGGRRVYRPITGGWLKGGAISALVAGGGEMLLHRRHGPAVIEATYYITTPTGASARLFGNGYEGVADEFDGLRLSLLAETDEREALAHLSQTAFVAEQASGSNMLTISRII